MQTTINGAELKPFPAGLSPMLLEARKEPFTEDGWVYEPKLDGMRCLAYVQNGIARLFSKSGREISDTFPSLAKEMCTLNTGVYDGEIVAHDEHGLVSFERLQERWMLRKTREVELADRSNPVTFFCYDILYLDNMSLTKVDLLTRKALLKKHFRPGLRTKVVSYFDDGITLFEACREHKFEGIVAKQIKSTYQCGSRSKSWQKIKYTQRDQFVILGYREEEGYLLGHTGRAVGYVLYGFTNADRKLLAERLVVKTEGLYKGKMNIVYEPTVTVDIEFMEWTGRKLLRAPVFRGITQERTP